MAGFLAGVQASKPNTQPAEVKQESTIVDGEPVTSSLFLILHLHSSNTDTLVFVQKSVLDLSKQPSFFKYLLYWLNSVLINVQYVYLAKLKFSTA